MSDLDSLNQCITGFKALTLDGQKFALSLLQKEHAAARTAPARKARRSRRQKTNGTEGKETSE